MNYCILLALLLSIGGLSAKELMMKEWLIDVPSNWALIGNNKILIVKESVSDIAALEKKVPNLPVTSLVSLMGPKSTGDITFQITSSAAELTQEQLKGFTKEQVDGLSSLMMSEINKICKASLKGARLSHSNEIYFLEIEYLISEKDGSETKSIRRYYYMSGSTIQISATYRARFDAISRKPVVSALNSFSRRKSGN